MEVLYLVIYIQPHIHVAMLLLMFSVKDKYGDVGDDEFTSSDSEEEDDDAEVNLNSCYTFNTQSGLA